MLLELSTSSELIVVATAIFHLNIALGAMGSAWGAEVPVILRAVTKFCFLTLAAVPVDFLAYVTVPPVVVEVVAKVTVVAVAVPIAVGLRIWWDVPHVILDDLLLDGLQGPRVHPRLNRSTLGVPRRRGPGAAGALASPFYLSGSVPDVSKSSPHRG